MRVLVLNCGGSSVKYQLIEMPTEHVIARGSVELAPPITDHRQAISAALQKLIHPQDGVVHKPEDIDAVGHRVVHGGDVYTGSVRITNDVIQTLEAFSELAPLHNPPNLLGIRACQELVPHAPMVAVFDSGLHQAMPLSNSIYALPYAYYERYGVRRYGFHGITFRYMTRRLAELVQRPLEELKIVSLMLGSGTTANAFCHGRSVDVSTGFTPTEGLVQSTRCGDIDPLAVTYLMRKEGLTPVEMDRVLNTESGWLGVSGVSNDFREVLHAAEQGHARSQLAFDAFVHRCRKYVGAYSAAMGGIDALVFSGGLGERCPEVRAAICAGLEFLGIRIDAAKNLSGPAERCLSTDAVAVWVIPTDEEIVIARDTYALTSASQDHLSHVG